VGDEGDAESGLPRSRRRSVLGAYLLQSMGLCPGPVLRATGHRSMPSRYRAGEQLPHQWLRLPTHPQSQEHPSAGQSRIKHLPLLLPPICF